MTSRTRLLSAASFALAMTWAPSLAGPGSGSASITPSADVAAGSAGTWSIQFTAAEPMQNGQLRVTIPTGWTAPQSTGSTTAGYVTVSTNQPAGNPLLAVGGQVVTIAVDTLSTGNTITLVYGDDAGGASARATAATLVGSYTFLVSSDPTGTSPVPIVSSPALDVIAGPPATIEVAPSDTTMTAGTFAEFNLVVRDDFGNRAPVASTRTIQLVASHGQYFSPSDHATPISTINIGSGKTSVRVDYRGTMATPDLEPHTLTVFTTSGTPSLGGYDVVNIDAAALSTTASTILATTPVVANGVSQGAVTVTSKDAFGNAREGDTVTLGVTGSAVKADPGSATDANGEATGAVTNTVAQNVTVSATINAQAITSTAQITFVAGAVSGATSLVAATSPVTANGVAASTITVTAKDANGNAVAGQSVTLAVAPPGGGAVLTQPGGVTDASGVATGTLTSTTTGARTVTAVIGGTPVTDDAVVSFVAGPVASFEWSGIDGAAVAGVGEPVTITAKDAQGNVITSYTGTVNLTTSSTGAGDAVVQWSAPDALGVITNLSGDDATYAFAAGDNGVATLRVTDTKAETITLTASGPASGVSSAIVVAPGAADKVQYVEGDAQSAVVNTAVATAPKVKVVDAFDNAVSGATVTFRAVGGGGSVDVVSGGGVDSTGTTASDGTIDCDVWRMGTDTDLNPNRLRALIASGSDPLENFTATATAGPGASLVLTPGSKLVTVASNEQVTATLTDSFGNLKSGEQVTVFIKTGLNGTLAEDPIDPGTTTGLNAVTRQGTTDAAGKITVRYVAPAGAGLADVLDASSTNVAQGLVADVTYTSTASGGATNYRITFIGNSTANAGQSFDFLLEAVDGNGNLDATNTSTVTLTPEAGSGLLFSLTDFGSTTTSVALVAGQRTVYGRGTVVGDWDITASGSLGSDTDAVTITDTGVIDHYNVSTVAGVTAGASFNVSVSARDLYNNLVDGAGNSITLHAIDDVTSADAQSELLVTSAALAGGLATVGDSYTKAEAIRVKVTDASSKEGTSGVLTVSAAAAKRIAKVSGDGSGIAAGSNRVLTAQVLDAYDNAVSGQTVSFLVTQGGGSVLPASTPSLGNGNASTTLTTGTVAGDNRVRATILDGTPAIDEQVEFSVQTVAGGIAYFTVVPQQTSLVAGQTVPLTVTAYDAGDNVVSLDNTTQVQLSSSGNAEFGAVTGTLTSGVFATTLADTVAQSLTVTAEKLGGGPPGGTSALITVTHAGAYRVVKTSGDGSGITAGATRTLQATVRDPYNNVVPGALVTFSVLSAPDGSAFFTDADGDPNDGIAVADGSGVAQVTYHTALTAGTNQVNAQILDGSPAAREKVTFTVNTVSSGATKLLITFLGPSTVAANQSFSFKVEALDASNNLDTSNTSLVTLTPEASSGLLFSLTDFGATTTTFNLTGGTRTVFGRGTTAGNWDITSSAGGLTGDTDAVTITHTGVVASYAVTAAASAQAGAAFTVTVEARDAYGNLVTNAANIVNLVAVDDVTPTPTGIPLSVTQATLVGGAVVVNESYTRADLIRVRARDAGSFEGYSGVVQITPAPAYRVANLSGNGSVVAGTTQLLTARVVDAYDNAVPGQLVAFSVVSGGGSAAPPSGSTSASGDVSTTLTTGAVVGTNVARATILDGTPAALETADFTVTTTAGAIANYEVTAAKTSLVANEVTNVTIKARDANGNYRTQDNTTNITISHTGDAALGATSGTLSGGQFVTTVSDTTAETFTVSAQTQGDTESGTSPAISVSNGPAYRVVKVSGDGASVPVGIEQYLRTEVHDEWGNTVANQPVRHLITVSPPGAYLRDAVGDSTDGITATLANGRALARLRTSTTVGAHTVTATILDGSPTGRERVTFNVTTAAGGIAYYTVQMNATSTTAGVSKTATITAYDVNNNVVDDDATQVVLSGSPGTGLVFGANPLTLSNGVASTSVTANEVQTYRVRAETSGNPSINGLGPDVAVVPAAPAGTITATATQNTITANGTSTTTITSGVIRDAFSNQVAQGLSVNVSASIGGVIVGGSPKTIDASGRISFDLRSSATVGTCVVTMTSVTGTATGTINIAFAAPPALACDTAPTPSIVVPGSSVAFSVQVDNASPTSVSLTTATTFGFSDGTHTYTANLAAPQNVPGSGSATLAFSAATVNGAFVPTTYAPTATLIGTDAYGSPVNVACDLPAASLLVTSIEITSIVPASGVVSRGQSSSIAVTVRNNGSQSTTIDDVDLAFIPSDLFTVGSAPEVGQSLGPGASGVFNVPYTVQAGATVGSYQVDAVVTGTVGGQTVTDNAVAPYPRANLTVQAAASLAYETGTMAPTTVSRGDSYAFQATVRNLGGGNAVLDSSLTRLTFTDGTRTYSAAPVQPYAVAGGATLAISFRARIVPADFTPGSYPVTLTARGTENGSPFTQNVPVSEPVGVVTPAAVAAAPVDPLSPDQVSKTTTATFTVQVQNAGQATVVLAPATTTIKFASNQYSAALNPAGPTTIPPGTTTLEFLGATVSGAIATGTYFPTVQLTGFENGNAFTQSIALTDGVEVQNAPAVAILAITPSQPQFTTDQTKPIKVRMLVRNSNGAAATFTDASLRFIHAGQDRTGQFVISTPTQFSGGALLSSGETDTVVFDVSDNAGNSMTPGNMTIEGDLEVEDVNTSQPVFADTDLGGKGNLQVMTPAAITFNAVTVSQSKVTQGMTKPFKVRAVVRNTGGSDAVLTLSSPSTRLNFSPSPGWVVGVPTLAGGGATLSGGELDTLIFNVTTTGSTPGATAIDVVTTGTESNSGRSVPGSATGLASVLVQTPGSIQIASIVPSQSSITSATTVPWTLTVTLTNPGESDVNLALGGAVSLTIQDQSTPPAFSVPGTLAGGGTLLSGGETDQLVIALTTSGTYTVLGNKAVTVDVDGTEVNSGAARNGNNAGSVLVQQAPDPAFASLTPGTVSKLTNVAFAVDVTNGAASNRATLALDRTLTRLRFGANQYNVGLAQASPVDIVQGATVTLQFTGAVVSSGIASGPQADAELELHWTHNGVAGTETIPIPTAITVQDAPSLSIVSVRPSRSTLTRQQSNAGTVTMVVRNSGGAAVDLDLAPSMTKLGFKVLGSGATVTSEYTVQPPAALEFAGGSVLAGGATDSLVFDLTQAGVTTGSIIVNGYVGGTDLNSGQPVSDDTFDGGSGSLELQLPGALSILSLTPAQTTATVGQTTKSYAVKMAVRNTGGAAIDVSLSQASSFLTFSGTSGWVVNPATMLNGVTLSGGETDTLRFLVTTTGGPAGVTTVGGTVSGLENNTGSIRIDDTASGGTGSLMLQTPAVLIVDAVTPSQASVTASTSAPWNTTVVVRNAGQSLARLDLPAGFSIGIQDATGGTVFVKPVDLEEGGVLLVGGAAGTLVAGTTSTGTFSSFGTKSLNVSAGAVEVNSNRALAASGSGSVTVQSAPNLIVAAVRPPLVTSESVVDFEVDVQNPGANAATVHFDRGLTRVHFASQQFSAFLDVASPDSIAAGDTETLRFEAKVIPASIALGAHDFNVNLAYDANGIAQTEPEVVAGGVTVQAAPQLFIQSIVTSQASATAGQTADWTATMTVVNNGSANIDLDLAANKTYLTFIGPGGQSDNTYVVNAPVMVSGDDILLPAETGQISFTVTQTGTQTGNVVISGRVEGTDLNQLKVVTDDTFDGGRGGIVVQNPASIAVAATRTSQPEVTAGQTGWSVRVVVVNTGGADVAINLAGASVSVAGGGWTFGAATLQGGGNVLEGGAVDSLLFTATAGPGAAGTRRIDAAVPWTEINSSASGSAGTATSGFGSITVEARASLRITSTVITAPNPAAVNVNQLFNVTVQVQNTGEADARNVVVGMTTNSASSIQPVAPLAVVPGGQTAAYALPVQAASSADASETFTTSLASAIDENSGLASLVTLVNPPTDATATVAVETPAVLDITDVRPSQMSVTRGQTNPWNVIVSVRNPGQSDAVLTPPDADDLDFSLAGATKIDYAVQPPSQFGSGTPGWRLAGGATDSLIYSVVDTGNDPGTVDIAVGVAGTDFNDPTRAVGDAGATTVVVQDVAGLYVEATFPVGTVNNVTSEQDLVNTGFAFEIHVTVQNSGGEDVDSVRVDLASDRSAANRSAIAPASLRRESIAAGASRDFVFRITASNQLGAEAFTASILPGVVSHNSGQPVIPQQPVDRRHEIVIQTRASLAVNLFVVSPPGSAGGVVATNQLFTLGARVSNAGQAGVGGAAQVSLTVPSGFTVQESLTRAFAVDDTVKWSVTAPPATQSAQNFTCAITTIPDDVNTGAAAFVSQGSDNQSITVSSGGALVSPAVALTDPSGATDDTLSVGQSFKVSTSVTVSRVKSLVGTLSVPAGFVVSGSPVWSFSNGAGTRTHVYDVIAPAAAGPAADLYVTFAAVDTITGDPVPSAADTVRVTVVPRTSLSVSASVTAPPDAVDNTVAIGTPFTVTATVTNAAGAADIAAPGSLQITLPSLYSLASGETAAKSFVTGASVSWVVNAPPQPSGPDQIRVNIAGVPDDENSGDPAQVTDGTATIAMVTEGAAVSVRDVSSARQVGTGVAPAGATGLDVLAFEIAYNVTDTTVADAQVDTVAIAIMDGDGNAMGPGVVSQTLARIALDLGGAAPYEVSGAGLNANPVLVSLAGGGNDRLINPDGSIDAVVYLDLDASPRARELRVRVTSGMVVRDPGSGQPLGVTDTQGRALDGQITSGPLVVLSSNFEEYAHNAPNPFHAGSSQTRISYFLDAPSNVQIRIFDITGELVYEESIPSSDPRGQPGPQASPWDGRNMKGEVVRNGIYACVLNAGSRSAKFRIAVAK
jgi:hypothetical protein